jgi:hypothetical protein
MAWSRLHNAIGTNGSGTGAFSITITSSTSGSLLAVSVFLFSNTGNTPTVADNKSGGSSVYSTGLDLLHGSGGTGRTSIFYVLACASGITSVTITPGGKASASVTEVSYTGTASLDVAVSASKSVTTSPWSSNPITTTGTSDYVLGTALSTTNGDVGYAVNGAWGLIAKVPDGADGDSAFLEEQLNLAAGTYSAGGTWGASGHSDSTVISWKAVAAAGGGNIGWWSGWGAGS